MKGIVAAPAISAIFILMTFSVAFAQDAELDVFRNLSVPGSDETFDISYSVQRNLVDAEVEILRKTITFTFAGKATNDAFFVLLPHDLIKGPFSVWSDKMQITKFDVQETQNNSMLTIPLFDSTEQIIIVGSKIAGTFNPPTSIVNNVISAKIGKVVYLTGDTVEISGNVTNPKSLDYLSLTIVGPKGNTVLYRDLNFDEDSRFYTSLDTLGILWSSSGTYTIKIAGKDANTFSKDFEIVHFVVPDWLKQNAGWWSENQIDDDTFLVGIQYLIDQEIIRIPQPETNEPVGDNKIPSWVKINAGWWSNGEISDTEFIKGIEFLIKTGIILIS